MFLSSYLPNSNKTGWLFCKNKYIFKFYKLYNEDIDSGIFTLFSVIFLLFGIQVSKCFISIKCAVCGWQMIILYSKILKPSFLIKINAPALLSVGNSNIFMANTRKIRVFFYVPPKTDLFTIFFFKNKSVLYSCKMYDLTNKSFVCANTCLWHKHNIQIYFCNLSFQCRRANSYTHT